MAILIGTDKKDKLNGKKNENNTIKGLSGNDVIKGANLNDEIYAGIGDDTITGGTGQNTINYKKGDGNDIIKLTKGENFTLNLENVNKISDVRFEIIKKDLRIYADKTNNKEFLTIKNFASKDITNNGNAKKNIADTSSVEILINGKRYDLREAILNGEYLYSINTSKNYTGSWLNEEINASNAPSGKNGKGVTLKAGAGDDLLIGSAGDDKLYGGVGKNEYRISNGDGNDVVYYDKNASNDVLNFTDAKMNELHIEKGKYNGIKIVNKNGDSFELANYLKNGKTSVAKIHTGKDAQTKSLAEFLDGKKLVQYGDFKKNSLKGTSANDKIYGDAGNDTIKAGAGDDIIIGGIGDDKLYGEAGENKFYFSEGDGIDNIIMGKGKDSIVLNSISQETVLLEKNNNDLIIAYGLKNDSIIIKNYFNTKYKSINTIYFADNYEYNSDVDINTVKTGEINLNKAIINNGGINFDNNFKVNYLLLNGNENNNLILSSKKYDVIHAEGGNDNIYIDSKIANVYGGNGNDTCNISNLKNITTLTDDNGNDTLNINNTLAKSIILFNVSIDNTISTVLDNDLFILNTSSLAKLKKDFTSIIQNGVRILDYFNNKEVEKINFKDSCILLNDIYKIKNAICDWLYQNNFTNSFEVIEQGSSTKINELITLYQNLLLFNKNDISNPESIKSDTYTVDKNDGNLVIYPGVGVSNIEFVSERELSNLSFYTIGKDLIIKHNNGLNTVTLKNFITSLHSIDNIIINNQKYNIYESNLYGNDPLIINSPETYEFIGGYGDDILIGDLYHSHIFYGGFGDDTIYAGGDDFMSSGNEGVSYGGYSDELVYAGAGNDTIYCAGGSDSVVNEIFAGIGDDKIYGGKGQDYIFGEEGDDYIVGRAGHDYLVGGDGDDEILGDNTSSKFDSEAYEDIIIGGNGNNYLDGRNGADQYALFYDGFFETTNENSVINDTGDNGKDLLVIFKSPEKINIWFDYNENDDFIFRIKDLDKNVNNSATASGIDEIYTNYGNRLLKYDYKNAELKYQVINWLTINSFSDVSSAMANGTQEQQESLLAIFNNENFWG